jgi:uncharacterized protein (TIGR03084 family)
MDAICNDLAAEHEALDALVAGLDERDWSRCTPADGWSIGDSISHLAFFDRTARLAAVDADAFTAGAKTMYASVATGVDLSVELGRSMSAAALLDAWRVGRVELVGALRTLDPKSRVIWYGPAMSARSFATARLMETWAHGQDVADALGLPPITSDRLRHVAHIGVGARAFSYIVRGRDVPDESVRVELCSPSGDTWTWGDAGAANVVRGDALDFCLAVTQRRHVDDTGLEVIGEDAQGWMAIAQSFAGTSGSGRTPGQFA